MRTKTSEKNEAIRLRKEGYSLNEISGHLGIAKSTASLWLKSTQLSETAKEMITRKRIDARKRSAATNRQRVDQKFINARHYGEKILVNGMPYGDAARVLCAMMYWCEGTKIRRRQLLGFTNSDPQLVRLFLQLLRTGFDIDESKLRLIVHVHKYHDAEKQLRFWSKVTSIPLTQCHRPYLKQNTSKRSREGYPGCASIRYMNVDMGRNLEGIAHALLDRAYS